MLIRPSQDDGRPAVDALRRGLVLVISSPSGAGKSTLSKNLLQMETNISLSVSVTTRPRRTSEIEGVHYHFRSRKQFELMRERGELMEWAEVHGNLYGTPRAPVEEALGQGRDILFDIDVQGTRQVYEVMRPDVASVFILPPSGEELVRRLATRAEDDSATIRRRLATALGEIAHWGDYDYVLVNDDINHCFASLRAILAAERLRRARQPKLQSLVDGLHRDLTRLAADPRG